MRIPETGTGGQPLPPRVRIRLEDPRWRLKRSWWILPSLLTAGVLGFAGFLWAGIKTNQRKYYISAGVWFLLSLSVVLLPPGPHIPIIGVACWTLPAVQASFMHQRYLLERAELDL